jgi:hypothetical protein
MLSFGAAHGRNRLYQSLNIVGGMWLALNTARHGASPSAAVKVVWTIIAAGALIPALGRPALRSE